MATETIEVTGHIVDSLLLAKILDTILDAGCDYEMDDVVIGKTSLDPSRARIIVTGDDDVLGPLLDQLQVHGANRAAQEDAVLVAADRDGVLLVLFIIYMPKGVLGKILELWERRRAGTPPPVSPAANAHWFSVKSSVWTRTRGSTRACRNWSTSSSMMLKARTIQTARVPYSTASAVPLAPE